MIGIALASLGSLLSNRCRRTGGRFDRSGVAIGGMLVAALAGVPIAGSLFSSGQVMGMLMLLAGSALVLQLLPGERCHGEAASRSARAPA